MTSCNVVQHTTCNKECLSLEGLLECPMWFIKACWVDVERAAVILTTGGALGQLTVFSKSHNSRWQMSPPGGADKAFRGLTESQICGPKVGGLWISASSLLFLHSASLPCDCGSQEVISNCISIFTEIILWCFFSDSTQCNSHSSCWMCLFSLLSALPGI